MLPPCSWRLVPALVAVVVSLSCSGERVGNPDHCSPGSSLQDGKCVLDASCAVSPCGAHGSCDDRSGPAKCTCATGWVGPTCGTCDTRAGFHDDRHGGCTRDPCTPSPCTDPNRVCSVVANAAECGCRPGTHDEGGACLPDTTCGPNSCSGHGSCDDGGGAVACACETGWSGSACAQCDDVHGYHPDGSGGCTTDRCLPDPCTAPHKGVCSASAGTPTCACDPGYHDEGGACVVDETCRDSTCSGHGSCTVNGGHTSCSCTSGYTGFSCGSCDTAGGFHDDGHGGCTSDPCLPNPCAVANRTTCLPQGASYVCQCVAGFHDDGRGGCSDDPCTPNLCLAQNQACRVSGGQPQCYTPDCDDHNPCTTDSLAGGLCQHAPVGNGTSCQTSLCRKGETCQAGTCQGGAALGCDDGNPCTDDSCDPALGCVYAKDDTNVPDDGIACTADRCQNGSAAHLPTDAICDDGKWCTGTEHCQPAQAGADARGCVHQDVPQKPASDGACVTYGACDEATKSFPRQLASAGTACNDRIPCTSGDACNGQGACLGSPTAQCGAHSCTSGHAWNGDVDIPVAVISGTITLAGQPLPPTNGNYDGAELYLVSKDTGAAHDLGGYSYQYQSSGVYVLRSGTYGGKVPAGVYDLLYRRNWDSSYQTVYRTLSSDAQVNGYVYLKKNLVLAAGPSTLNVDIPVATVSGNITLGGQPLPATNGNYDGAELYLVSKDTHAAHDLGGYSFQYQSSGVYTLRTGTYGGKVPAGTYDLLYRRNWDSSYQTVYRTLASDTQVNGYVLLRKDVTLSPGANTLNVDIPVATVSGTITLAGQPLPSTNGNYDGAELYLVSRDTGAAHDLGGYSFQYQSSGVYTLRSGTYGGKVPAGTYDLLYRRNWDSSYQTVYRTLASDTQVNGYVVLRKNVALAPGANTLDVDIPVATVSGTITLAGQPLPATNGNYDGAELYLVSRDTGAAHDLGGYSFQYQSSGVYVLRSGTYGGKVPAGTYDLLYRRNWDSSYQTVYRTLASDTQVNGYVVLRKNLTLNPGANTLDVDIPVATISGSITLAGQPLPATNGNYDGAELYLVSRDTGAAHDLGGYSFQYQSSGVYVLRSGTYGGKVPAGTYDLLYRRNWDSSYQTVYRTLASDPQVNGYVVLRRNVVIPAGASTLDVDIPVALIGGTITIAESPLPATNGNYDGAELYLVSKDTGAAHDLGGYGFQYQSSGVYVLRSGTYGGKVPAGTYDLLYRRNWDSSYETVYRTLESDTQVNGYVVLDQCVTAP